MSSILMKNMLRDIRKTKARFISIMLIIMLGVGFLVGINSTAPSMYAVVDKFYADTNLMDFRLISTVGFDEKDVKAVSEIDGVEDVMPSYFCDVLTKGDTGSVVRLFAIPEAYRGKEINSLVLKEGRFPEKDNEIIVGNDAFGDYALGDTISFFSPNEGENLGDSLKNTEYVIVGIADSPLYISFELGSTNVGSGKVAAYMMVPGENFLVERYTEVYVTFSTLRGLEPYSDEYVNLRDEILEKVKDTAKLREENFTAVYVDAARASVDEAQATFDKEKAKAQKEIADAQKKIDDGYVALAEEISKAHATLESAKKQITDGERQLLNAKKDAEKFMKAARQEIEKNEALIIDGEKQIEVAKKAIKDRIFASVETFGVSAELVESFFGDEDMLTLDNIESILLYAESFREMVRTQLENAEKNLDELKDKLTQQGLDFEKNAEYLALAEQKNALVQKIAAIDAFISDGASQLMQAIDTIKEKEKELELGKAEIEKAKAQLDSEESKVADEMSAAQKEIDTAWAEYYSGLTELNNKEKEAPQKLNDAQKELNDKKTEAEAQFLDAQKKLDDAVEKIEKIPQPEWYCNTRDNNPGYKTYVDNVDRVTAVGKVFPVFFLLVAVLVCVTTMTRLIEEQRGDLGAFTTLGYKKSSIMLKYIAYCASATIVGSAVGVALGVFTIPYVVFNAYRMLYTSLPELILKLNVVASIIATIVALLCTAGVAFVTCNSLLKKPPATLLRPKAPKPGKRIFLENIDFIWKRLGFFSKVTIRNIFRYKARFLMTVLGVAGCTALVVAAFGLYGSINDVVGNQFGRIFTYDAVVALDSGKSAQSVKSELSADDRIETAVLCRQNLVSINTNYIAFYDDTYLCVPEDVSEFSELVHLQDRKSAEKIEMSSTGVVLTEKLAKSLGVSVGDEVAVVDDGVKIRLNVDGICENYLYGYVYMSPQVYKEYFEKEPEYNVILCGKDDSAEITDKELGVEILDKSGVMGISFVGDIETSFSEMISSLNYVVLVMLVSAGALAFVVLYNLTNINIAERKREISTLKVLGFRSTETSAYIYRENLLLTVLGTSAGLVLGVWLLNFIIATVEIDMLMFGREIHYMVFVLSALITFVFAAVVNIAMPFRIKKIDMIESLKSVE